VKDVYRLCLLALGLASPSAAEPLDRQRVLPRLEGRIAIDGSLSDPGWREALSVGTFYEISPGDNTAPVVRTTAYAAYDGEFFYAAIHSYDPNPKEIRASYSGRDSVYGDQDFVQFDLDTKNDEKSSFIFRTNPLGVKADAIFSEATGLDDFSPDFSFEARSRIVQDGWIAEFRIPLSSLRYDDAPVQSWGITFYRNYPRAFRRQMTSLPIPRGANCWLCYELKLTQIRDLPPSRYTLVVPFATVQADSAPAPGAPFSDVEGGVDFKWIPRNDLALDVTYNPDFAQVEADVPQISVNTRFALSYPEKRGFFLEGADLLSTPLQAVYTRAITSPAWGARATGRAGDASYTLLLAKDQGGGNRIVPGPVFSRQAPQEPDCRAAIGRLRLTLGDSFAGLVFTDREGDGTHNRVIGPDLLWRPTDTHQIAAQWLVSDSRYQGEEDAADSALSMSWQYSAPSRFAQAAYQRLGHEFRADNGFIPQVGVDRKAISAGLRFYPQGLLRLVQPGIAWDRSVEIGGRTVSRSTYPVLLVGGRWNTDLTLEYHLREQARTETALVEYSYLAFDFKIQPSRLLSSVQLKGSGGEQVDFANARVGNGGGVGVIAMLRPGIHLNTELRAERQWLSVGDRPLFAAVATQLKLTYNFTSRTFVRAIAQFERTRRDPGLYSGPVRADEGTLGGSILFGYAFNWQTALYVGYGSDRSLLDGNRYEPEASHLFVKVAYAFEP
jgi:Domain of unknown function (DUF5916)